MTSDPDSTWEVLKTYFSLQKNTMHTLADGRAGLHAGWAGWLGWAGWAGLAGLGWLGGDGWLVEWLAGR